VWDRHCFISVRFRAYWCQLLQHHLFKKKLNFHSLIAFVCLSKINWLYMWESISGTFIPWFKTYSFLTLHHLGYCMSIIRLESSSFVLDFSKWIWLLWFFVFTYKFENYPVISTKKKSVVFWLSLPWSYLSPWQDLTFQQSADFKLQAFHLLRFL
jgi:hypothetical protein